MSGNGNAQNRAFRPAGQHNSDSRMTFDPGRVQLLPDPLNPEVKLTKRKWSKLCPENCGLVWVAHRVLRDCFGNRLRH
jgi:hypothetical protein